jgi:3-deoxy-D-manno-octulosonic-acid transferase
MNLLDGLYIPVAALTAPWWARKTRGGWRERFGHVDRLPVASAGVKRIMRLMVHGVSVGETNTLRELVPMLRECGVEVVVSATTDTGLARAKALYGGMQGVWVVRYPLDASWAVRRFLDATRVDAVGLVELELWPNFVSACRTRGVPIAVINGRLSERSFRGYRRFRPLLRATFRSLSAACVQDDGYAQRFLAMGVEPSRVRVTGSMKWDTASVVEPGVIMPGTRELASELGLDVASPIVVAGSTAPLGPESHGRWTCEEALLDDAVGPGVQLVCAPRKPEHYAAAFAALGGASRCVRRSDGRPGDSGKTRFLLDTIGELRLAYALADVCVIGRTFGGDPETGAGGLGGSDPMETAGLGKPTVAGMSMHNFESVAAVLGACGALRRTGPAGLVGVIAELLKSRADRERMGEAGRRCVLEHRGASARHRDVLLSLATTGRADF